MAKKSKSNVMPKTPGSASAATGSEPPETGKMNESNSERRRWISEAAYFKSLNRGLEPGHEEQDWIEAEKEYEAHI